MCRAILSALIAISVLPDLYAAPSDSFVAIPGTVVAQAPDNTQYFLASPSLTVLPNGTYVALHDTYGAFEKEVVYQSTNRGATWEEVAEFPGQWMSLFYQDGNLYAMGTLTSNGSMVIRRSSDGGFTWTNPTNANNGLLRVGRYSTGAMPVAVHDGRIWRAYEDLGGTGGWPQQFRSFIISAPIGSDLLNASSWTATPALATSSTWLGGKFNGWLEGNVLENPEGKLVNILRADTKAGIPEQAAIIDFGTDGSAGSFDPAGRPAEDPNANSGFIPFPGGAKKFAIRRDPVTGDYWSLVNTVLPSWQNVDPLYIRNVVSLVRSSDLRHWETRCSLLFHPDVGYHAFQYLDWQFDGNDLIALSRTSWQGKTYHDANFLTFHRISNFRTLTTSDSIPTDGSLKWPFPGMEVSGTQFTPALLENGGVAFSNRSYLWDEVPPAYAESLFTKVSGGVAATMRVKAKEATRAYAAASIPPSSGGLPGWVSTGESFCSTDTLRSRVWIYRRDLTAGQEITIPQTTWSGTMLISPPKSSAAAWWRCESTYGNTVVADELFAFHGKPSAPSGPVPMGFGRFGSALRFNPGQHVDLGNIFPLTRASFTISMWLRLDEGDTSNGVPLSKRNGTAAEGYSFEVNPAGAPGKISFTGSSAASQLVSLKTVNDNLWHHVAVTSKLGGDQILYVDGVEEARCPATAVVASSAALRFGARTVNNVAASGFSGWLDEIQIYHKSLSQTRVQGLSSEPPAGAAPPPVPVPASGFAVTGVDARVNWTAVPGQNYNIYRSWTLDAGSWELIDVVTPSTELGSFAEPVSANGKAFYRIEMQP